MTKPALHYDRVRGTKVTRTPRHIIAVVCELSGAERPCGKRTETDSAPLARWSACERRVSDSGKWITREECGDDGESFWQYLAGSVHARRACWIVAPCVTELLAATGGYAELTEGRYWIPGLTSPDDDKRYRGSESKNQRPGYVVLNGPTEILDGRYLSTSVTAVSASNYGIDDWSGLILRHSTLADYESVPVTGPQRFAGHSALVARCLARWYCGLIDVWKRDDCGTWGATAAGLSHSYYRRKYATGAVVKHKNEDAHRLERAATFGGRAEVYRHGPQRGRFHHLDYSSLYPSILASNPCPVALSECGGAVPLEYLFDAMQTHTVCARVRVRTERDIYPFRYRSGGRNRSVQVDVKSKAEWQPAMTRTIYPTGDFVTTLCGPDLVEAVTSGEAVEVYEHSIYRNSLEFAPMLSACLANRRAAELRHDADAAALWKLIANSFAGRWARRAGGWITDKRLLSFMPWSDFYDRHPDTGEPIRCRTVGWIPQYYARLDDKPSGAPIIFAWLTAMGRHKLAQAVSAASSGVVLATDTDGLWVDDSGLEACASQPGLMGSNPGQLRKVGECAAAEFLSPRHNLIDGKWTLSGFSDGFQIMPDGSVQDWSRRGLYAADTPNGPSTVLIDTRRCDIERLCDNHRCRMPDGTTLSWRIVPSSDELHRPVVQQSPKGLFD